MLGINKFGKEPATDSAPESLLFPRWLIEKPQMSPAEIYLRQDEIVDLTIRMAQEKKGGILTVEQQSAIERLVLFFSDSKGIRKFADGNANAQTRLGTNGELRPISTFNPVIRLRVTDQKVNLSTLIHELDHIATAVVAKTPDELRYHLMKFPASELFDSKKPFFLIGFLGISLVTVLSDITSIEQKGVVALLAFLSVLPLFGSLGVETVESYRNKKSPLERKALQTERRLEKLRGFN